MINELFGVFLADKYNIKADRIILTESIGASSNTSKTLANAVNGAVIIGELATYDYFLTKYTIWTDTGIVQVEIKPDDESINKIKTLAFTQKIESLFTPPKYVQTNVSFNLTNLSDIEVNLYIILDIFKIPQANTADMLDYIDSMIEAPANIDIQTLGSESLLSAILVALGGDPNSVSGSHNLIEGQQAPTRKCNRL